MRSAAIADLVISKAIRRGLSVKVFDWGKVEPAGGMSFRQRAALRQGLPEDVAKKISKLIRDEFPKLHGQIQGDAVRVSGKSKDELQLLIARLREIGDDYPVALQFQQLPLGCEHDRREPQRSRFLLAVLATIVIVALIVTMVQV